MFKRKRRLENAAPGSWVPASGAIMLGCAGVVCARDGPGRSEDQVEKDDHGKWYSEQPQNERGHGHLLVRSGLALTIELPDQRNAHDTVPLTHCRSEERR